MTQHINGLSSSKMFLFLLLGLLIVLAFRVVYSVPIEFNGESIRKWEVGRQLVDSGQWQLLLEDHHQLRWSVVIPQLFVGWMFPNSWFGYYITPIAFWSLFAVACLGFFLLLCAFDQFQVDASFNITTSSYQVGKVDSRTNASISHRSQTSTGDQTCCSLTQIQRSP